MDLAEAEKLLLALYCDDANLRAQAISQVAIFYNTNAVPTLINLMQSEHAVVVQCAANTVKQVLADNWNSLNHQEINEVKKSLLNVIAQRAPTLEQFAYTAVVKCLCFVVKSGLLDVADFVDFPREVIQFFSSGGSLQLQKNMETGHCEPVGIPSEAQIFVLRSFTEEIGLVNKKKTFSVHRRTAAKFRDECLDTILRVAIGAVRLVHEGMQQNQLPLYSFCEKATTLAYSVLGFEFSCMPEQSEYATNTTTNFPSGWKSILFKDLSVISLFWDLFHGLPQAELHFPMLQCLIEFAGARRSLFSDEDRLAYLTCLMRGSIEIMEANRWLNEPETFREFCRFLNRMKPNYQLTEFLASSEYDRWIQTAFNFTQRSFIHWKEGQIGTLSLLSMWTRLSNAEPISQTKRYTGFKEMVPQVIQGYLQSRAEMTLEMLSGGEDPFEDWEHVRMEISYLCQLIRYDYETLGPAVVNFYEPIAHQYNEAIVQRNQQPLDVLEAQLTWFVFIAAICINTHSTDVDNADAELIACVFNLMGLSTQRTSAFAGNFMGKSFENLAVATVHFLQNYRINFIGVDQSTSVTKMMSKLQSKVGLSGVTKDELKAKLLELIVNKITHFLTIWGFNERVLGDTLKLFEDMCSGYVTGKQLNDLDCIQYLLKPKDVADFPFQNGLQFRRWRHRYRQIVTKFLFQENFTDASFKQYIAPFHQVLEELGKVLSSLQGNTNAALDVIRTPNVQQQVVGVLFELRGVVAAAASRRSYSMLFEFLFPRYIELLVEVVGLCQEADVILETAILRFLIEFCNNSCERISFEKHSVNGFLLFKMICVVVQRTAEKRLLLFSVHSPGCVGSCPGRDSQYAWLYKGSYLIFNLFTKALSGGYCNFGVFSLYQDTVLRDTLFIVCNLMCIFPFSDLLQFPKVALAFFALFEQVAEEQPDFLAELSTSNLLHILHSCEYALQAVDLPALVISTVSMGLCHFVSKFYRHCQKQCDAVAEAIKQHFSVDPLIFHRLLSTTFSNAVFEDGNNVWIIAQPILPLILADQTAYDNLISQTLMGLQGERYDTLSRAFEKLFDGISKDLDRKTSDKFVANLSTFRFVAKSIL